MGNELRNRPRWYQWIHQHNERRAHDNCDWRYVADKVEIEFFEQCRVDGVRRTDREQRVAVGRRPHNHFGANVPGGTGPILYDKLLTKPL